MGNPRSIFISPLLTGLLFLIQGSASTYAGAAIGLFYILSGLFTLPLKKWGAALAILCLAADVTGWLAMVVSGLYPVDSFKQAFAIFLGTLIAVIFAVYIGLKWRVFN